MSSRRNNNAERRGRQSSRNRNRNRNPQQMVEPDEAGQVVPVVPMTRGGRPRISHRRGAVAPRPRSADPTSRRARAEDLRGVSTQHRGRVARRNTVSVPRRPPQANPRHRRRHTPRNAAPAPQRNPQILHPLLMVGQAIEEFVANCRLFAENLAYTTDFAGTSNANGQGVSASRAHLRQETPSPPTTSTGPPTSNVMEANDEADPTPRQDRQENASISGARSRTVRISEEPPIIIELLEDQGQDENPEPVIDVDDLDLDFDTFMEAIRIAARENEMPPQMMLHEVMRRKQVIYENHVMGRRMQEDGLDDPLHRLAVAAFRIFHADDPPTYVDVMAGGDGPHVIPNHVGNPVEVHVFHIELEEFQNFLANASHPDNIPGDEVGAEEDPPRRGSVDQ